MLIFFLEQESIGNPS